jgi:hypothetical protein
MFTTNGTYPWSFVTQIFHNGQPSHGGNRNIFEVMTSTLELPTVPKHLSSPPVFSGFRITRSFVFHVCFVDRYLSFCPFLCPLCSSSIYGF